MSNFQGQEIKLQPITWHYVMNLILKHTEDEMAGWHHRLDGHESELTPGVGNEQGSLACCSPWGRKELDTTK